MEFSAFNPSAENVNLSFAVRNRWTTNYQTRVDVPIALKPGRNHVWLGFEANKRQFETHLPTALAARNSCVS